MNNNNFNKVTLLAIMALFGSYISCAHMTLENHIDSRRRLHSAIALKNIELVRPEITSDNINLKDENGFTALHLAAHYGNLEIVKLLVEAGAQINMQSRRGTPIALAKNPKIVKFLKKNGAEGVPLNEHLDTFFVTKADIDNLAKSDDPNDQFLRAANMANCEKMKELCEGNTININHRTNLRTTAMQLAARSSCKAAVDFLIANGANVKTCNKYGWAPIHFAITAGSAQVVESIINANPSVLYDETGSEGLPCRLAVEEKNLDILKLIIDKGFDRNIIFLNPHVGNKEESLLHAASRRGSDKIIRYLLELGLPVNLKTEDEGMLPIHSAATSGRYEAIKVLIEAGANVNAITKKRETAIELLLGQTTGDEILEAMGRRVCSDSAYNRNEAFKLLSNASSPETLSRKDAKTGDTLYHKVLVSLTAPINWQDDRYRTVIAGVEKRICTLLLAKVDHKVPNHKGLRPEDEPCLSITPNLKRVLSSENPLEDDFVKWFIETHKDTPQI